MDTPTSRFDETTMDFVDRIANLDLASEEATTAVKNLESFTKCRPPEPEPTPEPIPDPTTVWGKFKRGLAGVWDNETTRVLIKSGATFAGVGVVAYSTIHKDHVLERQAIAQANQSNS
jgi:hypothetical protein